MDVFLQQVINGLVMGSMYALVALGYTMVYGIINLINFAHGEVLMVGALTSWSAIGMMQSAMPGTPGWIILILATLIACVVAVVLNFTIEKVAYRPLRNSPKLAPLITAIGMSILLQTVAMIIWKPNYKAYPTLLSSTPINLGGAVITPTQIMILGVTAVSLAVLMWLVNYTRLGRAMRATAENPRVAGLMGVKPDMVISATFVIGAILAAIAGVMYASNYGTAQHAMGFLPGLKAFTAAVFGGIGNLSGAVVGGILLGLIEAIGSGYIGQLTGGVLGSHYTDIFAFIVLIFVLTLRPSGLMGTTVMKINKTLQYILIGVALIVLPLILQGFGNAWVRIADMALLYILLAVGLNIVVGYAGLLDLGYVAFFAVGAYMYGLLSSPHLFNTFAWIAAAFPEGMHMPIWLIVPVGAALAGIFGMLLGAPTLKLRGDYLAIVTLGFGEIIRVFMNNLDHPVNITNGPKGLDQIDPISVFGINLGKKLMIGDFEISSVSLYYYLFLSLVLLAILISHRLEFSRIGRAWMAIREDEIAAKAMGLNTRNLKLLAFGMGATFGGVSGAMFAGFQGFISPESFSLMESVMIVAMVVLGGLGYLPGGSLPGRVIASSAEMPKGRFTGPLALWGCNCDSCSAGSQVSMFRP
eukprot:gene22905-27886_t